MRGYSRRELLGAAGAGAAGIYLGGCGGEKTRVPSVNSGNPWKQFAGTELNFISENTPPTAAIAADLAPFEALTGIKVSVTTLELTAMVQKVALDFASGLGNYHVVYADPYQVLSPYHRSLAPLRSFMEDDSLPQVPGGLDDFVPIQLAPLGRFEDELYCLPYDCPSLVWAYRKDLFDKHRERMEQDLQFDPTPSSERSWDQYHRIGRWLNENAKDDVPWGYGQMAKQHDALTMDFTGVLQAFGGAYFEDDFTVGTDGKNEPGAVLLDRPEALEAADFYQRLIADAHPSSKGWDWAGNSEAFMAGQIAMTALAQENASAIEAAGATKGKAAYAPMPRGPKRNANMFGGTGIGINAVASERERKASWLFLVWATAPETQLRGLKSDVGGGTPTRTSVYEREEVRKATQRPSKLPNLLPQRAIEEGWKRENIGLRPKIPAWNEVDTTIFSEVSKMLAGGKGPEECMRACREGTERAIENTRLLTS